MDRLKQMFNAKVEIMALMLPMQDLPEHPLEIDSKNNQSIIRDFVGWTEEEMTEAFEVYSNVYSNYHPNDPSKEMTSAEAKELLKNYAEELADVLQFFLSLMLYLNIEWEDIDSYVDNLIVATNINNQKDTLLNLTLYARYMNQAKGLKPPALQGGYIIQPSNGSILPGMKLGMEQLDNHKLILWDVTYWLNQTKHCLKNKPWKKKETETDIGSLHQCIMEAWLHLFRYFEYVNYNPTTIFTTYMQKHDKIIERVKNNY